MGAQVARFLMAAVDSRPDTEFVVLSGVCAACSAGTLHDSAYLCQWQQVPNSMPCMQAWATAPTTITPCW